MSKYHSQVEEWINCCFRNGNIHGISKEEYKKLQKQKIRTDYAYQNDYFEGLPRIFKFYIIEDDETATNENGCYDWGFLAIFTYKGKYYLFEDYGGI